MTTIITITITSAQTTISNTRKIDLKDDIFFQEEQLSTEVKRLADATTLNFITQLRTINDSNN